MARPPSSRHRLVSILLAGVAVFSSAASGAAGEPGKDSRQAEFFEQKIRPVLVERCYRCHSAESKKQEARLRLDNRESLRRGGESGPAIVPGDPAGSLLMQALRYEGLEMPPDGKVAAPVLADFETWIRDGAYDPRHEAPGDSAVPSSTAIDYVAAREHWSLRPLTVPARPAVADRNWSRTGIDAFIQARWPEENLRPASEAPRSVWLRRVTFDLTGLPPSLEELAEFAADTRPTAWEHVVDRLLASPHFGERLARLWLDLARYAEDQAHIVGKDESLYYPNAYLYRDWVIQAINEDIGYDRFVHMQLAADLTEGVDSPHLPALGFVGLGPKYYSRRSLAVMADEWEDRVDIVGRGLLGLTLACARCHDHKYDAISTEDYYAMAGVFASTQMFNRPLTADAAQADGSQQGNNEFENGKKAVGEAKDPKQAMHIVTEGTATDLNVFIRGNVENKGPLVPRRFLRVLSEGEPANFRQGSGRRELADAITSANNPLFARVLVNRIWGFYLGRPLSATPSNFGQLGEHPTHPELLDDLSVRFVRSGWSFKWLVREIVLSATYRQSSLNEPQFAAADPENRLLAHMSRRRLSVEQWRDAILAANGRLDRVVGGPSIDPQDPAQRRRTIYSRAS
ncbi:MAG: PSD1 and planctomycete cytochrome C domain-containing protein, partial [Pirellulaceae bacterium]